MVYVVALVAAIVLPPKLLVYALATVPVLVVSVNMFGFDTCLIPEVVQAGAEIAPENVKLPLDIVAPLVNDAPLIVGLIENTKLPVPVASLITLASCALVVAANALRLLAVVVNVPLVGSVRLVFAVVAKVKL